MGTHQETIALILICSVYLGLVVVIIWAAWNQHKADMAKALALRKEYEADKANNENEINSMPDDKLVELANERNRRVLSSRHGPKKG